VEGNNVDEALYRNRQAVRRLFGPAAALIATAGSRRGPGHIEIRINGKVAGIGATFERAVQDAIAHQRTTCWPVAEICLD
jgi:hypothetical protein